jgi:hypothetical protein
VPEPANAFTTAQNTAGNATQDVAPNTAQDAAPNTARDVAPNTAQDAAPNTAQDAAPNTAQDAAPNTARDVAPNAAQDVAPPDQNTAQNKRGLEHIMKGRAATPSSAKHRVSFQFKYTFTPSLRYHPVGSSVFDR